MVDSVTSNVLKRSQTTVEKSFTFTRSDRFRKNTEKPIGFYDIPPIHNKRSTSFGIGERTKFTVESSAPPPGQYNPLDITATKGRKISTSNLDARLKLPTTDSPGPGTYTVIHKTDGPSFTLKPRLKKKNVEVTPSAGNYNPVFTSVEKKSFSKIGFGYGHKTVFARNLEIPGPGTYSVPSFFPSIKSSLPHKFKPGNKLIEKILSKQLKSGV